ncbi:MAG TPA: M48 family metallopeptidase [Stenomitos sp.]
MRSADECHNGKKIPNGSMTKVRLIGLKADQFRHPLDLQATATFKQWPGWDWVVRSLAGSVAEQALYLENISSGILVGPQQLPDLHALLLEACQILDLMPPQLYVRQNPIPNAYTLAIRGKQPFIVLHTSLIDLLTPPEIQAVIAHELGHLKCEHGVYLTLANMLVLAVGQLPYWGEVVAESLKQQLLTWLRCAEFTCDRAGLLVSQDPTVMISLLMKLTGGSPTLAARLNVDAFLNQARAYRMATDDLSTLWKMMQTAQLSHPLPVLRASAIDEWANSPAYRQLMKPGHPPSWS